MQNVSNYFCPLTKEPCRENCAWLDLEYDIELDNNGMPEAISGESYCAIAVIAGALIDRGLEW